MVLAAKDKVKIRDSGLGGFNRVTGLANEHSRKF
jgi:hypothetical protein